MSKPIELQKGDKVRGKVTGRLGTVIANLGYDDVRVMFAGSTSGYEITVEGRGCLRFVSRPSAATTANRPKVGDIIRPIMTGDNRHSHVVRIEDYTGECVKVDTSDSTCAIKIDRELYWFKWSEIEIKPNPADVAIDINTNSIESMEKALKEIDSQRDILADKLLAKKKELRAKMAEKEISNMLNGIKSQSSYIQIRNHGCFAGKGVYLSKSYNWEIKVDDDGIKVLVPTKP